MEAILVMWPVPVEQTVVVSSHEGSIRNLTLIGPAVSEEKLFKNVVSTTTHNKLTTEAYLSYKLTTEPSVQVS